MIADFLIVSGLAWGLVCLLVVSDWVVGHWFDD